VAELSTRDESFDEIEDGAAILWGQGLDDAQLAPEAKILGRFRLAQGANAKQLVDGDAEDFRELAEEMSRDVLGLRLVVREHAPGYLEPVGELGLRETPGLADAGQSAAERLGGRAAVAWHRIAGRTGEYRRQRS